MMICLHGYKIYFDQDLKNVVLIEDFSQIDLKEIEGNIDDNTEKIIKNAENNFEKFIVEL